MRFLCSLALILTAASAAAFGQKLDVIKYDWHPNYLEGQKKDDRDRMGMPDRQRVELPGAQLNSTPPEFIQKRRDGYTRPKEEVRVDELEQLQVQPDRLIAALVELRNSSERPVDGFVVDFVFYDRQETAYLRYRIESEKNIAPGEAVKVKKIINDRSLVGFSSNATMALVFGISPVRTAIEVVSIRYVDGTEWKAEAK